MQTLSIEGWRSIWRSARRKNPWAKCSLPITNSPSLRSTRVHVAGGEHRTARQRPSGRLHRPRTRPYFLGSLILVKDGPTQYQVIDGQQRLISLSIIVSVLRELEATPDLIDSLTTSFWNQATKLRGIKAEPRLTLRERDTDFFRMYVQEGDLEDCSICATTISNRTRNATSPSTPDKCSTNSRKCPHKTAAHSHHTSSTKSPSSS